MSAEVIEVVEIQGKSEQGFQEPYQCLGSDGNLYYVKGRQTDRASLCKEWVCAHLGRQLGLPIPPFRLMNVSDEIIAEAPVELRAIGSGLAFGSQARIGCTWFSKGQSKDVDVKLQAAILAFDWWIQNTDRTDWNHNLLWDAKSSELVVIDHNLTIPSGAQFSPQEFLANHIFRAQLASFDLMSFAEMQQRFCEAADAVLDEACDNIPPEWSWMNPECDLPSNMDLAHVKATILRCKSADFWRFQ